MTKRETTLALARIAGYHGDRAAFTRLLIECRVNRQAMNEAFWNGQKARANGVGCTCCECKKAKEVAP